MQCRKAIFLLRISTMFCLLSSWEVRPALSSGAVKQPSEMPDRPTLAAAWALKWQPDPQRSTKRKTRQGVVPAWKKNKKREEGRVVVLKLEGVGRLQNFVTFGRISKKNMNTKNLTKKKGCPGFEPKWLAFQLLVPLHRTQHTPH